MVVPIDPEDGLREFDAALVVAELLCPCLCPLETAAVLPHQMNTLIKVSIWWCDKSGKMRGMYRAGCMEGIVGTFPSFSECQWCETCVQPARTIVPGLVEVGSVIPTFSLLFSSLFFLLDLNHWTTMVFYRNAQLVPCCYFKLQVLVMVTVTCMAVITIAKKKMEWKRKREKNQGPDCQTASFQHSLGPLQLVLLQVWCHIGVTLAPLSIFGNSDRTKKSSCTLVQLVVWISRLTNIFPSHKWLNRRWVNMCVINIVLHHCCPSMTIRGQPYKWPSDLWTWFLYI